jgi:uncharacterized protein (DUF1800 family)
MAPRRELLLGVSAALQAVFLAAACGYDRTRVHPLKVRRTQVAHLLRRAGFGYGEQQLDEYEALGVVGTVDRLLEYEGVPDDSEERAKPLAPDLRRLADLQRWWLFRMVYGRRPLQEKMTLFWHGLLTSATGKVGLPNPTPQNPDPPHYLLDQHRFLRAHALDRFETLIAGISKDPAMMIWLDAQVNNRARPNENYARELMELFTLGLAGPDGKQPFTEQDVREVARALTGRGLDRGAFVMRSNQFDPGVKTILGKTGAFGAADVFRIVTQHPAAPWHLARRLFCFFAHPDPTAEDLRPLVAAYQRSDGSVKAVLRALFLSPAFYSQRAYRALVKSPAELVAGALRATGSTSPLGELPQRTTRMGQALFNPPNVAGWPGGVDWITTTTWLERVNFANLVAGSRDNGRVVREAVERHNLTTAGDLVAYYGDLLLDGQVPPAMRTALLEYAGNGSASSGAAIRLTPEYLDRKGRGILYLFLASPQYQLA